MSRKISVQIVGDSASLQRAFQRSGASAKLFERDLSKSVRGVAAASLSFHGLGRALSFASGYFLASGGIVFGLKAATKAAVDHQAAQAQLAAAMTHAGVSFKDYGAQVEDTLRKQRDLAGFSEDDTNASFTKLLRTTRSVSAATRDNALSMEIARGAGIGLNAASNIVNKTLAGQTTGLRRLGVELPKGVSGYRALQIAGAKYAGSVTAFAGTAAGGQARLTNALHETEVTVGTALLPTITKYTTELADWLNKSGNQQRIQRDVNAAVKDGTAAVKVFAGVVHGASDAVGGFKHLIELLIGLKVASVASSWVRPIASLGRAAKTSRSEVALLHGALLKLGALGVVTVGVEVLIHRKQIDNAVTGFLDKHGLGFFSGSDNMKGLNAGNVDAAIKAASAAHDAFTVGILEKAKALFAAQAGTAKPSAAASPVSHALRRGTGMATGPVLNRPAAAPLDALSKIQNQVARARLAVAQNQKGSTAQLVAALKAEIDYDAKYAAIQEKLAKRGGKNAKTHSQTAQALLASETSDLNEITSLTAKHAAAAKKTKKTSKAAAAGFAVPLELQRNAAKASASARTGDDLAAARSIRAYAQKVLRSGKTTMQTQIDAWNEIASQNATIAAILGNVGKSTTHSVVASSAAIVKGIHFASKADKMAVEARIAQVQSHGGRLPTGHGVLGQSITIQNLHVHGVQSVDDLLSELQKRSRHGTAQRRGPHAGAYMGLH